MFRQIQRVLPQTTIIARRNFGRPFWDTNPFVLMDKAMREVEREFKRLENNFSFPQLGHSSANRPFRPFAEEHPTDVEFFRIKNPIVEENGVKKFKLEFDVRRFKPEEVQIKTNAKHRTLQVEAKTANENSKFEYFQKVYIPDGITPEEITCKLKSDGILEFEAPYKEKTKIDPPKDAVLQIKHE